MIFRDPNILVKINEEVGSVTAIIKSPEALDVCGYVDTRNIEIHKFSSVVFLDGSDRFITSVELPQDGNWLAGIKSQNIGQDNNCMKLQAFAVSDMSNFAYPLRVEELAMNTYAEFVKALLPADSKDVPSFRNELRELIIKATKVPYVARSIFQSIQTGNNYQTINFGQSQNKGGRISRENFLYQIDFRGKTVLDIGANTGENSRIVRRLGANLVDGYEYDPFFVEIGRAINAAAGMTRVSLFQGDATNPELFRGMKYDIVLGLAVWIYLQKTIAQVAEITDTLVFETHTLDHGMEYYYSNVLRYFPHAIALGLTDRPKDPHKGRMFVVFGKDREKLQRLVSRDFVWVAPYFNNQFIKAHNHLDKNKILEMAETFLSKHGNAPTYATGDYKFATQSYFEVFLAGLSQYLKNNKKVDLQNVYLNFLRQGIKQGVMDQALAETAANDAWMIRKVANKYEDAMNIINGNVDHVPPVEIVQDSTGTMKFTSTRGESFQCHIFDGHHRFFMCELVGAERIHFICNSGNPKASA